MIDDAPDPTDRLPSGQATCPEMALLVAIVQQAFDDAHQIAKGLALAGGNTHGRGMRRELETEMARLRAWAASDGLYGLDWTLGSISDLTRSAWPVGTTRAMLLSVLDGQGKAGKPVRRVAGSRTTVESTDELTERRTRQRSTRRAKGEQQRAA